MLRPSPLGFAVGLCALLTCTHPAAASPIPVVEFAFPFSYGFVTFSSIGGGSAAIDLALDGLNDDTSISGPNGTFVLTRGNLHAEGFQFDSGYMVLDGDGVLDSFEYRYEGTVDWTGEFDMRRPDGAMQTASFNARVSSLSVLGGSTSGALTFNVHKARFDPATAMLLGVPDARLGGQQYVYLEFANGDEFDVDHEGRTFGYMSLKAPEPTTWMLATVGLGALWRRRRRVPGRE